MIRKDLELEFVALKATDDEKGQIEGIANIGNVKDLQGDTMLPGCWRKVIEDQQRVALCWAHDAKDIRGKITYLEELPVGDRRIPQNQKATVPVASALYFKAQMAMKTQAGREAYELIKGDYIRAVSVGFDIADDGEEPDGKGGRNVKLVNRLYEISNVLAEASVGSAITAVKTSVSNPSPTPYVSDYDRWEGYARAIGMVMAH